MLSTRRFALRSAMAIAGLISLSACGSWFQRPPDTASAPCSGLRYLEVHNSLETSFDLYGYPPDGGNARFLGTVSPGTQRVVLDAPVGATYALVGGQRVTSKARTGTPAMSITRGCEAATN